MSGNTVTVVRDGKLSNIDEKSLKKKDIIVFQTGDIVPADIILTEAEGLEIDEFELTGEIMPVEKRVYGIETIIYKGSKVIRGTGKGIIIATAGDTEYEKILNQKYDQVGSLKFHIIKRKYFILIGLMLPLFIANLIMSNKTFISLAFYIVLVVLLLLLQNSELFRYAVVTDEIKNFERKNIQIRDVDAIEKMNLIDIMCFDKTGVLTTREMDIRNIYIESCMYSADEIINKKGIYNLIYLACALCNDVSFFEKLLEANQVDKTLISFAEKNGVDFKTALLKYKRIYHKPFNSEDRYMASGFISNENEVHYFLKGDPEIILNKCDDYITQEGIKKKVDLKFLKYIRINIADASKTGDVLLALAYATTSIDNNKESIKYTFLCLLQLGSTLRQGAQKLINKISAKGIRCVMLTGDRGETAAKISEECGIANSSKAYLLGRILQRMEFREVARQATYCSVFARLLPSQKAVIIRLFQQDNHCVAMVGDGPNDGIALKVADVGISFIENSSVIARELSKILINDLEELLLLIEGANRIYKRIKLLKILRISAIVMLFVLYIWVIVP